MPGSSNNSSFIPKRGTAKRTRKVRNLNIYILNILSYVLFFAALLAAAGVFFYSGYIREQLNNEVATMSMAVSNFKEADMQRVQEFDIRLRQANNRLNNSASVVRTLEIIEENIIDTVRFANLSLTRERDSAYTIEVVADTDTFDSSIFQRDTFVGNESIRALEISEFALNTITSENGQAPEQSVSLSVEIMVPLEAVPYEPGLATNINVPTPPPPVSSESETEEAEEQVGDIASDEPLLEDNQNEI